MIDKPSISLNRVLNCRGKWRLRSQTVVDAQGATPNSAGQPRDERPLRSGGTGEKATAMQMIEDVPVTNIAGRYPFG